MDIKLIITINSQESQESNTTHMIDTVELEEEGVTRKRDSERVVGEVSNRCIRRKERLIQKKKSKRLSNTER